MAYLLHFIEGSWELAAKGMAVSSHSELPNLSSTRSTAVDIDGSRGKTGMITCCANA